MKKRVKGQGSIITIVLLILIVFAAIIIVWNIVKNTVKEKSGEIEIGVVTVDLSVEKAEISGNDLNVLITRNLGGGNLTDIRFVLKTSSSTYIIDKPAEMSELETKLFTITASDFASLKISAVDVKNITISPFIKSPGGKKVLGIKSQAVVISICQCLLWQDGACGAGGCLSTQRQQTRKCTPSACDVESQCIIDNICIPPPIPGPEKQYENYATGDDSFLGATSTNLVFQTITVGSTGTNELFNLNKISIKVYRVGIPGMANVSIRAVDANGKPTGFDLSKGSFNASKLTLTSTAANWTNITMTSYNLQPSTKYAIILNDPDAVSLPPNDMARWRKDYSSSAYLGGQAGYSADSGATWDFDATGDGQSDLMFRIWGSPYI